MLDPRSSSFGQILRDAGLRRTPARVQVLELLGESGVPLAHSDLVSHPSLAGIDEITLYRTLTTLSEAGLVHRIHGIDGAWRYGVHPGNGPGCPGNHAHFLCTRCRQMTCLSHQSMPRVELPEGVRVEGRHFLVFGACASCGNAPPSPADSIP